MQNQKIIKIVNNYTLIIIIVNNYILITFARQNTYCLHDLDIKYVLKMVRYFLKTHVSYVTVAYCYCILHINRKENPTDYYLDDVFIA